MKEKMKDIYERIRRKSFKRIVNYVIDGDTFAVEGGIEGFDRIRLSGVDTPELGSGEKAEEMKEFLKEKILGKQVKITIVGYNAPRGKFKGRWVAEVYSGFFIQLNISDSVQLRMTHRSIFDKIRGR